MWHLFLLACLVCCALLYVPGFALLLAATRMGRKDALALAPLVGVTWYALLAVVLGWVGMSSNPITLVLPLLGAALLVWALRSFAGRGKKETRLAHRYGSRSNLELAAYVAFGVVVTTFFFVRGLDGPDSFFQAFDNGNHLNTIRVFLETSNFSSFNSSAYGTGGLEAVSPFVEGAAAFYPAAWHGLVALVVEMTGAPLTLGVNAVNAVIVGVVFPVGMFKLISCLFPKRGGREILIGSVISIAFVGLSWDFVSWGPLYPMLLSYALALPSIACFVSLFEDGMGLRLKARQATIFVVGCVGIALSQPSGIFAMAVFLAPFLVWQAYRFGALRFGGRGLMRWALALVAALFVIAVWALFHSLPLFQDVVEFNWPKTTSVRQGMTDVVLLSMASHPAQLLLAFFVMVGIVVLLATKGWRWMPFSYAIVAGSYVLSVATEGWLKHFVTGFWYTDPHRLAANVCLVAVPLAVVGASFVLEVAETLFRSIAPRTGVRPDARVLTCAFALFCCVAIFYPSYELRGMGRRDTAFGNLEATVAAENSLQVSHVLDADELAFAREALELVPEGSLIINSPNDGSGFLYAVTGANMLYREFSLPPLEDEKPQSHEIRFALDEYGENRDVQEAVGYFGARYLLVLDQGDSEEERPRFWSYYPEQWEGIEAVRDDTPGFTVLLARDDMRLYEIG